MAKFADMLSSISQFWRKKSLAIQEDSFELHVRDILTKILNQSRKGNLLLESNLQTTQAKLQLVENEVQSSSQSVQQIWRQWQAKGLFLREDEMLVLCDQFFKFRESLPTDIANQNPLLENFCQKLLTTAGLTTISMVGGSLDAREVEIMAASASEEHAKGIVLEIISHGFRRTDGSVLRKAKVIVSSGPSVEENSSLEGSVNNSDAASPTMVESGQDERFIGSNVCFVPDSGM